jgi:hypothetical protein
MLPPRNLRQPGLAHLFAEDDLSSKNNGTIQQRFIKDGEKPVLFVPYFFRELLGFLPLKQRHTE